MSHIDHIILFLFLFLSFYFWGRYNYNIKDETKFWLSAIIPILLYTTIVGSRYGWGVDYMGYKYRYEYSFSHPEEQIGFRWINQGLTLLGFNYVGAYMIYGLIYITSAFILIRSFGKESKYMYAFVIPASLIFITSIIRQGVALGFILLAIYFLNKKKWVGLAIALLIAVSIHTASLITIVIIGSFYLISKQPLNWKITIPLYIFFAFIFDVSKTSIITNYIQYIPFDTHFQGYVENADRWFGKKSLDDQFTQNQMARILSSAFYISIIYLGYHAIKYRPKPQIIYLYNSVVFGLILFRAVFNIELLRRFATPLESLYFIILGYSIYIFSEVSILKKQAILSNDLLRIRKPSSLFSYFLICILVYVILFWGRFIFLNPEAIFFWNK